MNELAAIIAFVCYTENINQKDKEEMINSISDEYQELDLYLAINSEEDAEADIYWALDRLLMSGHLEMFRTGNEKQTTNNNKKNGNNNTLSHLFSFYYKNILDRNLSCGLIRSKRIFENYLY